MRIQRARSSARVLLISGFALACVAVAAAPTSARELTPIQPPGVAEGAYRGQCRLLNRQIARYTEQAAQAIDRDNDTWLEASYRRIGHLTERRARLCPKYVDTRAGEDLLKLIRLGGKVALKMFTWGII